eukprot:364390-Chlamydomonas_euryale.AAC.2
MRAPEAAFFGCGALLGWRLGCGGGRAEGSWGGAKATVSRSKPHFQATNPAHTLHTSCPLFVSTPARHCQAFMSRIAAARAQLTLPGRN